MFESYSYDNNGNMVSRTDFNSHTTIYAYDTLNRLTSKTPDPFFNAPAVSFTYTATGQRHTMTDAHGTTTYGYDSRDRLLSKQAPNGTLSYTYDDANNLLTLRSSNVNGTSMDYTYDPLNRLSTAVDNRRTHTTSYTYDDVGNLHDCTYGNGVVHTWSYDAINRLTNVTASKAVNLASYTYTLKPTGHRQSVAELSGRTVTYAYDDIYRLTGETIANTAHAGVSTYSYDAVGNRLSRTSTIQNVTNSSNTFDDNDRLNTDSYDSNGNTTNSDGKTYTYDFENRIKSVNGTLTYVYDGDGNRVRKTVNGTTTKYLVDTNNLTGYAQVVEELSGGAVVRVYAYGLDLISQDQPINNVWTQSFYGYDGHGSVRFLTDAQGLVTDLYDYDAFGILISQAGNTPNNYLYCGEQFDADLGMYYLRARYMNQGAGRFWTMDEYEGDTETPASLHKYTYVRNCPSHLVDPSGYMSLGELLSNINTAMIALNIQSAATHLINAATADSDEEMYSELSQAGWNIAGAALGALGASAGGGVSLYANASSTLTLSAQATDIIAVSATGIAQLGILYRTGTGGANSGFERRKPTMPNGNDKGGWQHIYKKHITGQIPGGDLFPPGTTRAMLEEVAEDVVKHGRRFTNPSDPVQIFDLRMVVNGERMWVRTIIVRKTDEIITMFPFTQ